jgi:two-component system chemotaxis response regulator CheB
MAHCPTPILVVSASTNRGELFRIYEALAAGAVDVMEKPIDGVDDAAWAQRFVGMVKLAARIRVITHLRGRLAGLLPPIVEIARAEKPTRTSGYRLVAIGASTGGPGAIVELLRGLSPSFDLPILLVLHMDAPFATAFADWLDGQNLRPVYFPRDGEPVSAAAGRVAVAPGGHHLTVRNGRMYLTQDLPRHSCRPSVDVLLESVAAEYGAAAIGCLLTGMGRDGAEGLLRIRQAGGFTIAQDEETSVIYGMPREAVNIWAARMVLPLSAIGPQLVRLRAAPQEAWA